MEIDINANSDALIVVDIQNDFAHPDGSLYLGGTIGIIPTVNKLVQAFDDADALVIYTKDWHPETTTHFESNGGKWLKHCIKDTWGAEFHEDLEVLEGSPVIKKGSEQNQDGFSGFRNKNLDNERVELTDLNDKLKEEQIRRVFICGVATDYCVKQTALDSAKSGYETYVIENAIKAVDKEPGDEAAALRSMDKNGAALVTFG